MPDRVVARTQLAWPTRPPLSRAALLGVLLLLAALATGRVGPAVFAVPLLASAVLTAATAQGVLTVAPRLSSQVLPEGDLTTLVVDLHSPVDLDVLVLDLRGDGGLALTSGAARRVTCLRAGVPARVSLPLRGVRWGRRVLGPLRVSSQGPWLGRGPEPLRLAETVVRVQPRDEHFDADESLPQPPVPGGSHRTRVLGEGFDLAGVRPFVPGDRLRRVNWRVSSRARSLHVTQTHPDQGAHVLVLVDSTHDPGGPAPIGGDPSGLDRAVRAAAGIAAHYLRLGDSVSFFEYGGLPRYLPPAAGRGQLARVLEWLLDVRVHMTPYDSGGRLLSGRLLTADTTVIALTPLLDQRVVRGLADLRRRGQTVLVVDTLPEASVPAEARASAQVALVLWRAQREAQVASFREVGVPVVVWQGAGSLDTALREAGRMASRPRAGAR